MNMLHALLMVLGLMLPTNSGDSTTLDDFREGITDAGQVIDSPWRTTGEKSLLETTQRDGQRVLTVEVPFATHPDWSRVNLDRKIKLDLSRAKRFVLEVEPEKQNLKPFGVINLFFHSPGGWYVGQLGFGQQGRQKLVCEKDTFYKEGSPAGWDQIDGIRISLWQGQAANGRLILYRLSVPKSPVLIVAGGAADRGKKDQNSKRAAYAQQMAKDFEQRLADGDIEAEIVDEEDLSSVDLEDYQVVVLPYNPQLLPVARDQLLRYVEGGGKLFACYQLDPKLGQAIGIQPGQWKQAPRKGSFAEIHFDQKLKTEKRRASSTAKNSKLLPGMPAMVKQDSWNLVPAKPVGHHARVVGMWFDDAGQPIGEPALLMSDRGAYLTHVVLPDNPQKKTAMVRAILGKLSPTIWKGLAEKRLEKLDSIGHDSPAQTEAWIRSRAVPKAVAELEKSRRLAADASKILNAKKTTSALDAGELYRAACLAEDARQARENAYLFSQSRPKPGQRRGFWEHSGFGAYPGDWDRTMRELSEAGFNAIFTNVSCGGGAHYHSKILPKSRSCEKFGDQLAQAVAAGKKYGIEVHAWKVNHKLSYFTPPEFAEKLRREGRLAQSVRGEELAWLCPSHPKNFELERNAMLEMAEKYDIDGVHFDYIRYKSKNYCYCDGCRKRFEAASGKKVERWPHDCFSGPREEEYIDWRCGNITRLVKAVHEGIQKINPKVKVSAAVFQSYPTCRRDVGQDWLVWAKKGYVDFLCPMDYQPNMLSFENIVAHQLKLLDGAVPLCPGIGLSASGSRLNAQQLATQIFLTERLGTAGFTIFNLSRREAKNILPRFKEIQEVEGR